MKKRIVADVEVPAGWPIHGVVVLCPHLPPGMKNSIEIVSISDAPPEPPTCPCCGMTVKILNSIAAKRWWWLCDECGTGSCSYSTPEEAEAAARRRPT